MTDFHLMPGGTVNW